MPRRDILFFTLAALLLSCCAGPDMRQSFAPPQHSAITDRPYPRVVALRDGEAEEATPALWLGMKGKGRQAMVSLLPLAAKGLPAARDWKQYARLSRDHLGIAGIGQSEIDKAPRGRVREIPLAEILDKRMLGVPFHAKRVLGVALNHKQHMEDFGYSRRDIKDFAEDPPRFFWKRSKPVGPYDAVQIPVKQYSDTLRTTTTYLDHEVEIGLVVGKRLRREDLGPSVKPSEVLAGLVLANDFSDREAQIWGLADPGKPDAGTAHWARTGVKKRWNKRLFDLFSEGKSHPTFTVLGPFLISPQRYGALQTAHMELWRRSGGKGHFDRSQHGMAMQYLHKPMRLLRAALEDPYLDIDELQPGDVLLMGTPAGTVLKGSALKDLLPYGILYPVFRAGALLMPYLRGDDEVWTQNRLLGFQHNIIRE